MGGCGQVLTFPYNVGGWVAQKAYVIIWGPQKDFLKKDQIDFRTLASNQDFFDRKKNVFHAKIVLEQLKEGEKKDWDREIMKWNSSVKKFIIHIRNLEAEKFRSHVEKCL